MSDEKTIEEEVAAQAADDTDIDEAKDRIEDADDIDSDAVRDEIRDEDDDTRGDLDRIIEKLDEIAARIDARIDGLSRVMLDGGAVISDGQPVDVIEPSGYMSYDDMDLNID